MLKVMVTVNHLKKGMYVSELDRPWLESPFIFQGFRITNLDEINKLQDTCEYVYVDKEKSIVSIPQKALLHASVSEARNKRHLRLVNSRTEYSSSFEEELPQAWETYKEALTVINDMLYDVRIGENLKSEKIRNTVSNLSDSVIRHPDALALLCSLKDKGNYAVSHAINVCVMSLIFGRYLGLEEDKLIELGIGALLHDIGETMVPDEILLKEGERTPAENKVMISHTKYGPEIIQNCKDLPASAIAIARDHHERADGSGYPHRLNGMQISKLTKIVSIVDTYDSITSGLYGKPVMTPARGLKYVYDFREQLFDEELVESFIQCLGIYPVGSVVEFHSGEVGIVLSADPKMRLYPKLLLIRDREKQPLLPPKLINLALLREKGHSDQFKIGRIINPDKYDIDVRKYIWRDLNTTLSSMQEAVEE